MILELRKEARRTLDGGRRRVTEERRGRVRAIEVFGGYLDVDKLSDTDRKLIEDFAKLIKKLTRLKNCMKAETPTKTHARSFAGSTR